MHVRRFTWQPKTQNIGQVNENRFSMVHSKHHIEKRSPPRMNDQRVRICAVCPSIFRRCQTRSSPYTRAIRVAN